MVSMTEKAALGQPFFVPPHENSMLLSSRNLTIGASLVWLIRQGKFIYPEKV